MIKEKIEEALIKALTFKEKKQALGEENIKFQDDVGIIDYKWRNIRNLVNSTAFNDELKILDISKEELSFLLNNNSEFGNGIYKKFLNDQTWFKTFLLVIKKFEENYSEDDYVLEYQLCLPFVMYFKEFINYEAIKLKKIKLSDKVIKGLEKQLIGEIELLTLKCIIVEMDKDFEKYNKTNDSHKNYLNFMDEMLKSPKQLLEFYLSYPVLARLITQKTMFLLNYYKEIINNLDVNFTNISELFNINNSEIDSIYLCNGDSHERNKTVSKITFINGIKLFYKPKNLFIEKEFNKFIEIINSSNLLDLYINKVFYSSDFTIELEIEHLECLTEPQIGRFYYRHGMLLCLISLLNGTDMHYENIIAHGEYPCIIDFETLFTHFDIIDYDTNINEVIRKKEGLNLVGTCLLPSEVTIDFENNMKFDLSALSDIEEITAKVLMLEEKYTHNMCYVEKNITSKMEGMNIPKIKGVKQNYIRYKQNIINGFSDLLNYILNNKSKIISCMVKFENLKVRQVLKDTKTYSNLLGYINHPEYLKDMIRLEKLLENNWATNYKDKRVIPYEINDMLNLDVPIFYTITDNNCIITSEGDIISQYFEENSLTNVVESIQKLNEDTVSKEVDKLSLILGEKSSDLLNCNEKSNSIIDYINDLDSMIIKIIENIANTLENKAVLGNEIITWIHVVKKKNYNVISAMDNSLGYGISGILLFLHYLNRCSLDYSNNLNIYKTLDLLSIYQEEAKVDIFEGPIGIVYSLISCDEKKLSYEIIEDLLIGFNQINLYEQYASRIEKLVDFMIILDHINKKFPELFLLKEIVWNLVNSILANFVNTISNIVLEKQDNNEKILTLLSYLIILSIGEEILQISLEREICNIIDLLDVNIKEVIFSNETRNYETIINNSNLILSSSKYLHRKLFVNYLNWAIDAVKLWECKDITLHCGLAKKLDFYCNIRENIESDVVSNQIYNLQLNIINYYIDIEKNNKLFEYMPYSLSKGIAGIGYVLLRSLDPSIPSVLKIE